MPDGNISLDQFLARQVAGQTRFPTLNTAAGPAGGGFSIYYQDNLEPQGP